MRGAICCVFVLAVASLTIAAEPVAAPGGQTVAGPASSSAAAYDLEKVEQIEHFVGSKEARRLLGRQGMVVTDQQFKQIFSAYIGCPAPMFITVDSAWHTYHVLLEEGLRTLEDRQMVVLRRFCEKLYRAAKTVSRKPDNPDADAYLELAWFAGVGWAALDSAAVDRMDALDRSVVEDTLRRLRSTKDQEKVLFFSLPVAPRHFRAAGFYTKSDSLRRYFFARQWFAKCNFRLEKDLETDRALRLVALIESDKELKPLYEKLTRPYDILLGPPDDNGVDQYSAVARGTFPDGRLEPEKIAASLDAFRREAEKLPGPKINDQLLTEEEYDKFAKRTKGFRLLPARRLPSSVLFQNTVAPVVKDRVFPSGVDMFAAGPLACDAGRRALRGQVKDTATADRIESTKLDPLPDSLHGRALGLFKLLQKPLPEKAPAPLRGPAWHDKQLWTALGAWAEQRHSWALHGKPSVGYLGGAGMLPPGYVSPYPEFFRRLAALARDTGKTFKTYGDPPPTPKDAAKELLACVALERRMMAGNTVLTAEDSSRLERFSRFDNEYIWHDSRGGAELLERTHKRLEQLAKRWEAEEDIGETDRTLIALLMRRGEDVESAIPVFADMCDKLAVIAEKQLADKPLNEDEAGLIACYGKILAELHFYKGDSWIEPDDDFPLISPVFEDSYLRATLYAGTSRPEALWVIVNVKGRPVLHRGAVLSYREFTRPSQPPLDDDGWIAKVRKGSAPVPPAFTGSFRQTIPAEEVIRKIRDGEIYSAIDAVPDRAVTRVIAEMLLEKPQGKGEFSDWLLWTFCERATNEDIPDLLKLLKQGNSYLVGPCIAQLNWKPHRAEIMKLLRYETSTHADAAADILSSRPEDVDLSALASTFDDQPTRTRRLYCHVLGHIKGNDEAVTRLLLKMLDDEEPYVRYQAALAASRRGVADKRIVERLIAGLTDKHECAAAAMTRALTDLRIKKSAPNMLSRLKQLAAVDPPEDEYPTYGGGFGSRYDILLHSEVPWYRSCVSGQVAELATGLSALRYEKAKGQLREMVGGPYSLDVLSALAEIDRDGALELAAAAVLDETADWEARRCGLHVIRTYGSISHVELLLPLLDVIPRKDGSATDAFLKEVASAMGELLREADPADSKYKKMRLAAIAQLRKHVRHQVGLEALEVLIAIAPERRADFLLQAALGRKADYHVRTLALQEIVDHGTVDPNDAHVLLPLLDEATDKGYHGETLRKDATRAITDIVSMGANADTRRKVVDRLRKMLTSDDDLLAVDALIRIGPDSEHDLLVEFACDKRLKGITRMVILLRLAKTEDLAVVRRLLPLLDDDSVTAGFGRIRDLAADVMIQVAVKERVYSDAERAALKKLKADLDAASGEDLDEMLVKRREAARRWATADKGE